MRTMRTLAAALFALVALGIFVVGSGADPGPTITSDASDYAPGSLATLTGAGWGAAEEVQVVITGSDDVVYQDSSSLADDDGGFVVLFQLPDQELAYFEVVATGSSGASATTAFSDGRFILGTKLDGVTLDGAAPPDVTTTAGATLTAEVTVMTDADLCLPLIPCIGDEWRSTRWRFGTGAITCIDVPNPDVVDAGTYVRTFPVTAPSTLGTFTFAVQVFADNGCAGSASSIMFRDYAIQVVAPPNTPPNTPASLGQFKSNGTTAIPVGGGTDETTVVLKGNVSDPNASDLVRMQVEVKPVGTPFNGTGVIVESGCPAVCVNPHQASITVSGLTPGASYHWRARAEDINGAFSAWMGFGGNSDSGSGTSDADFTLDGGAPVVTNVATSPALKYVGQTMSVTATATDAISNIASAQYSLDAGAWTPMSAADSAFDEKAEDVTASFLAPGGTVSHTVCVRATDQPGNTSAGTDCTTFSVISASAATLTVSPDAITLPDEDSTLTATVTTTDTGVCGLGGRSVRLFVDWAGDGVNFVSPTAPDYLATVTTNSSGVATYNLDAATITRVGMFRVWADVPSTATCGAAQDDYDSLTIDAPTTIVYSGESYDTAAPTTLSAQLSSPATNGPTGTMGCLAGRTVQLREDVDGDSSYETLLASAATNASGFVSTTASLPEGIHLIRALVLATTYCGSSFDDVVVTFVLPGGAADGGGWYKYDPVQGSPRVNFGFTVRKVPNTTNQYKGQLVWMNNGKWRLKGTLDGTNTFGKFTTGCPSGLVCGSVKGMGTLSQWIDPTPLMPLSGDEYWGNGVNVTFTATFYDGGSAKKGGTLKPDYFGMQIDGVAGPTLPESAPIQMKGGNVTVA